MESILPESLGTLLRGYGVRIPGKGKQELILIRCERGQITEARASSQTTLSVLKGTCGLTARGRPNLVSHANRDDSAN